MAGFINLLISYLMTVIVSSYAKVEYNIVETSSGLVRGRLDQYKSIKYYSYKGIPYAESPTGFLRFQPSVPKKRWSGIYNATEYGPVCPQVDHVYRRNQMSENCLVLNIFVPLTNNSIELLPVVVNIHGGGFTYLSGDSQEIYGPELLLQKSVVYISINFRLGALGFLSLNTEKATGNAALKDVILSLKWIRKNLSKFNGSKNKVTLIGNSSGAVMIHFLMLSNNTSNLFQQLIIISGSAFNHRSLSRYPTEIAYELSNELGIQINNTDTSTFLNSLTAVDPFKILNADDRLIEANDNVLRTFSLFVPNIEIMSPHAVLTKHPKVIMKEGPPQNVRVLAGIASNEGLYMYPQLFSRFEELQQIHKNKQILIPSDIEYPINSTESIDLGDLIFKFYLKNDTQITYSNYDRIIEYISDINYVYDVDLWTRIHKQRSDSRELYFYEFAFDGALNWAKRYYNNPKPGAGHGDEIGYLYLTALTKPFIDSLDQRNRRTLNTMLDLITNFIKYGNPTPAHLNSDTTWPEYGREQNYLVINDELKVMQRNSSKRYKRMCFWDQVYEEYYKYVRDGGILQRKIVP
ncbi:juvenile hormone esterase-like [Leptidea sinapis]|uniref:juvenile hormone esterase-like n=1 Tax=Leptidea sinapis TaxID=189913 RepID=UPI002140827C|nr:juvenile hormone esterase-like [Leptidea sinapis]